MTEGLYGICPLMTNAQLGVECKGGNCAWFDSMENKCCIWVLSSRMESLEDIASMIENIATVLEKRTSQEGDIDE